MKLLVLFVCLSISTAIFSQDFEGIITYKTTYPVNNTGMSDQQLKIELGTISTTYFKDGSYKDITNSKFINYQCFNRLDSVLYYMHNIKSDTLYTQKLNPEIREVFNYNIEKKTDTILGYVCDKLTVKNESGTYKYYYSTELKLNPDSYKNFTLGNKDKIVGLMQSLYLRLEIEYIGFSIDIVATEVIKKKLKSSIFKIPEYNVLIEY